MQRICTIVALAAIASGAALAHGDAPAHGNAHATHAGAAAPTAFGRAGDPAAVTRTVTMSMSDGMRFTPAKLEVKKGETVRVVLRNDGKLLHEMVLGTEADLARHAALMRRFPGMEHEEPNMVHVQPGERGELVWTFDRSGQFAFACLIPGHFEAGMSGKVVVR
jgi:uncharacterized cupredoxin-like copper-binding protein